MSDLHKIVWLASYPKSGNTWFRAFLTALLNPNKTEVDINSMYPTTIASSRQLFDKVTGVTSSDLTSEEIQILRPSVYRQNALEAEETIYHKIHDAWTLLPEGEPMFPPDITKGVIYFIRNPLDVAVSFAHHLSTDIDRTICIMNDPDYAFCDKNNRLHNQLEQKLLTWSGHAKSWVYNSGLPVLVLRYEDMKNHPIQTFSKAADFLMLNVTLNNIENALEASSFTVLQQQERDHGFSEKSAHSKNFFRNGTIGDWMNVLNQEQVNRITGLHKEVMKQFGYL